MTNIILGVSGSVATIKTSNIISGLKSRIDNCQIVLIPTESALHFLPKDLKELHADKVHLDVEEWEAWKVDR